MADKILKELNKINKLCKRLFDSYLIYGDYIVGQKDGKPVNTVFCRLTECLDISVDNPGCCIHVVPETISALFKEYKSKELDSVIIDNTGEIRCILPSGSTIPFALISPVKDNITEFITTRIKEINEFYDKNICYDLNDNEIDRLNKTKQVLIVKDEFKLFICKSIFPTIKRNGTDRFVFYFNDIDDYRFKSMSVMSDKENIMDIFGTYQCVHF